MIPHSLQVILQVNSFGKGYGHGTPSTQENKQIIFKGNSFEKGYGHGTPSTEGNHKLFSKEILLKKATDTGHLWSKKNKFYNEVLLEKASDKGQAAKLTEQVFFKGNSFTKSYGRGTPSTRKLTSYFTRKFF